MKQYCFGIDIGGTTVKMGLFDTEGNVLEKWEIKTRTENKGINILPDVAQAVKAKIEEKGLKRDQLVGIGAGVPAPVRENGVLYTTANLGWGYVEIEKDLSDLTGLPVKAGNDANVAALGEMWKGGAKGSHNVVMVTLGTGVGGGIIVNGKIIAGTHGSGGEIGHIHVEDSETARCGCGNHGCLEQFASATGIVRMANRLLEETDTPSVLREGEVSAKTVFDAVKAGDALAVQVAELFGKYLGSVLASIASTVDPEVFVIGGGVSKAGQVVIDYIKKRYEAVVFGECKDTAFALAELGNDAGIYGAAKLILG